MQMAEPIDVWTSGGVVVGLTVLPVQAWKKKRYIKCLIVFTLPHGISYSRIVIRKIQHITPSPCELEPNHLTCGI